MDRFSTCNKAIHFSSVANQLQVAQSQALGGANHQMGFAPYFQPELKLLSRLVFRVARMILGAGPHVTQGTLAADNRFMPEMATALMKRWRFLQSALDLRPRVARGSGCGCARLQSEVAPFRSDHCNHGNAGLTRANNYRPTPSAATEAMGDPCADTGDRSAHQLQPPPQYTDC